LKEFSAAQRSIWEITSGGSRTVTVGLVPSPAGPVFFGVPLLIAIIAVL
jgi:hypothetical protein